MGNVAIFLFVVATALLFRWQGDSWPITVAKVAAYVALSLLAVTVIGGLIARWS